MARASLAAAALLWSAAASPAGAGILDAILPAPNKAEALDPAGYDKLTHLIVVGGETRYQSAQEAQELILGRVEQDIGASGCWQVMPHAKARAKLPHATLSAPNPKKWANSDEVSAKLLSRLPKRDERLGVLVLWVREWRGNVYSRDTTREAVDIWIGKRITAPGTAPPTRGEYERDAEAQLFDSTTGAQLWRAHFSFPSGTPLDENHRLPYAEQETRDAQIKKEYGTFISFFATGLRHPPNMQNGCRERPEVFAARAKPAKAATPSVAAAPDPDAQALAALKSEDPAKRAEAVKALGREDNEAAVEPLVAALGDPDLKVRAYALDALGAVGSAKAVEPVSRRLMDKERLLRALAARSLGRIGSDRAKPALQKLLSVEKEQAVRDEAQAALRKIDDPLTMKMDVGSFSPRGLDR